MPYPFRGHRLGQAGAVLALLLGLTACGGVDSPSAVSSNPSAGPDLEATGGADQAAEAGTTLEAALKAATIKIPVPRDGQGAGTAPADSAPDGPAAPSSPTDPALLLATGFEAGVTLTEPAGLQRGERRLRGQDAGGTPLPVALAGAAEADGNVIRARIDDAAISDVSPWLGAGLVDLIGPDNQATRALTLASLGSGGPGQSIALEYGRLAEATPIYQRMRVKFDPGLLARAQTLGQDDFYLTIWEACSADLRLRVKLVYVNGKGLVWQMKYETLRDPDYVRWTRELADHPVVLAADSSPLGWHTVEVLVDPASGQYRVAIDGRSIAGPHDRLPPRYAAPITTLRPAVVADTPVATVHFDALELRRAVPADASWAR